MTSVLFAFLCFLLLLLVFSVVPKPSADEVLSSVPDLKAVMRLMEKTRVLGKFHSGMRYSAVGCEFTVNQSVTYIN